jgi:hypothetical protein
MGLNHHDHEFGLQDANSRKECTDRWEAPILFSQKRIIVAKSLLLTNIASISKKSAVIFLKDGNQIISRPATLVLGSSHPPAE